MAEGSWLANSSFKLPIIKVCFDSLGVGENDAERMTGLGSGGGPGGFRQNSSPNAFLSSFCQVDCGTIKSFVSHH